MRKNSEDSTSRRKNADRCLFGYLSLQTGMHLLCAIGAIVIFCILGVLYMKFRKAMFIMLIPSSIVLITVLGVSRKKSLLVWPIVAVSCFHVVLSSYALLIFSFYFIFKPYYIIMVLNWAFNTLHTEKTPSYYVQCTCIYLGLTFFLLFNTWQGHISYRFKRLLSQRKELNQPTVLVVNKPPVY